MFDPFPVSCKTLRVADYQKLRGACKHHFNIFRPDPLLGDRIPETSIPGPRGLTSRLIEAPLNFIELLEAVLKPSRPFQIHKTRHVSQPAIRDTRDALERESH
ncbi:hypothetical protein ANO14919_117720 [Xylariales sp. No.14919]|nr:hypothetical protein F5X98DRAFT_208787 [Xylaria grammica]GAW22236.1 hypothetical protein ANO14919_117720 [Xylariales sp. No.14919]